MLETLFIPTNGEPISNTPLFKFFNNTDMQIKDNIQVTQNNALSFDTVYACINVLSDDVAKLPFKTYKKGKDGAIEQIKNNDVHKMIRVRPNERMTPFGFIKLMMTDVLIHGNAYALIVREKSGEIREVLPMTSTITMPYMHKGKLYYMTNIDGKNVYFHADEVIHIKGMSTDGLTGLSPIQSVRLQLESNAEATKYNRDLIRKEAVPRGVLEVATTLNPDAK